MMTRLSRFSVVLTVIVLLCGCDESSSPTEPDETEGTTTTTETYTGSLAMGDTSSHQIGIGASGTAEVLLLNLEPLSTLTVGVGIGTVDDAGTCTLSAQDTSMKQGELLSAAVVSGVYCVSIFDVGNIPEGITVEYSLELHLPSIPVQFTTLTGTFGIGERACHDVAVSSDGSLEATLVDLQPLQTLTVGMGVGVGGGAVGCSLFAEDTDVGIGDVLLSDELSPGPYCVCVFDVGNIFAGQTVSYELRVEHP